MTICWRLFDTLHTSQTKKINFSPLMTNLWESCQNWQVIYCVCKSPFYKLEPHQLFRSQTMNSREYQFTYRHPRGSLVWMLMRKSRHETVGCRVSILGHTSWLAQLIQQKKMHAKFNWKNFNNYQQYDVGLRFRFKYAVHKVFHIL